MSRMTVRSFLALARAHLRRTVKEGGKAKFVIGNESADLDSITSALVYGYIQSSRAEARKIPEVVIPVVNIPAADLPLRPELTALLRHAGLQPTDLITVDDLGAENVLKPEETEWTLVDHNVFLGSLGQRFAHCVTAVIDHHDDEQKVPSDAAPRIIEKSGSCSSLIANFSREAWDTLSSSAATIGAANGSRDEHFKDDFAYTSTWDAQLAKLALGAILIDTINMTAASKVTDHDRAAVRYLEAKVNRSFKLGKDYDRDRLFEEINDAKSDIGGLTLFDVLRKDYKQWSDGDLTLGIAASVQNIDYLLRRENNFLDVCQTFAQQRELDLFAVMTAFNGKDGKFGRELLLIALNDGMAKEAAERFASDAQSSLSLKVQDRFQDASMPWLRFWEQQNLDSSRKQVAPLIRQAMRGGSDAGKL